MAWTWRRIPPPRAAGEVLGSLQQLMGRLNDTLRTVFFELEREARPFRADADYDWPNVASGAYAFVDVAMPGVRLGHVAVAGFSQLLPDGVDITAKVIGDNLVRVYLVNTSGAAHDASAGTISVRVWE